MTRCFNSINIFNRNTKRLEKTSLIDVIREALKNGIIRSQSFFDITIAENKVTFFNDLSKDMVVKFTYQDLLNALDVFSTSSDVNFHEGITTFMKLPFGIFCGNVFQIAGKYKDGNYQEVKESSHDENGKLISEQYGFTNGWRVEFYDDGSQQFQAFKRSIVPTLNSFYCTTAYKKEIIVNGSSYKMKPMINMKDMDEDNNYGKFYSKLQYSDTTRDIEFIWAVDEERTVFHTIKTIESSVSGQVIFTDIRQFANENRQELSDNMTANINNSIRSILDSHHEEMLQELFKKSIPDSINIMALSIAKYFKIAVEKVTEIFTRGTTEEAFEIISAYINTANRVLEFSDCEKVGTPIIMPGKSTRMLSGQQFQRFNRRMSIKIARYVADTKIGPIVTDGDIDGILTVGDFTSEMTVATNVDVMDIVNKEFDGTIVVSSYKYLEYVIDASLIIDYDESDFSSQRHHTLLWNNISALAEFDINNTEETNNDSETINNTANGSQIRLNRYDDDDDIELSNAQSLYVYKWHNKVPIAIDSKEMFESLRKTQCSIIPNLSEQMYNAWRYIVTALVKKLNITAPIYPALSYKNTPEFASFGEGIIMLNLKNLLAVNARMQSMAIIENAIHEICHTHYKSHGKKFYFMMEDLLREMKKPVIIEDTPINVYDEVFSILATLPTMPTITSTNSEKMKYYVRWLSKHQRDLEVAIQNDDTEEIESLKKKIVTIKAKLSGL